MLAVSPVELVGNAQPGVWMEDGLGVDGEARHLPAGPVAVEKWAGLKQTAFQVMGATVENLRILAGDFVICVPYGEARPGPVHNDVVVIERHRDNGMFERTIKQVDLTTQPPQLSPRSTDARYKPVIFDPATMREPDGTVVRIVGLVIGCWRPFDP